MFKGNFFSSEFLTNFLTSKFFFLRNDSTKKSLNKHFFPETRLCLSLKLFCFQPLFQFNFSIPGVVLLHCDTQTHSRTTTHEGTHAHKERKEKRGLETVHVCGVSNDRCRMSTFFLVYIFALYGSSHLLSVYLSCSSLNSLLSPLFLLALLFPLLLLSPNFLLNHH